MIQDNDETMMFQVAITSFICGLINEKAVSIKLENDDLIAIIPNFKNAQKTLRMKFM